MTISPPPTPTTGLPFSEKSTLWTDTRFWPELWERFMSYWSMWISRGIRMGQPLDKPTFTAFERFARIASNLRYAIGGAPKLGACATTTNFSTVKFALSKFYCRGDSHKKKKKTAFWTIFLSTPKAPPLKKRKFYFYCRLAVSEKHDSQKQGFSPWTLKRFERIGPSKPPSVRNIQAHYYHRPRKYYLINSTNM